jgi:hypothetical protein
MATANVALPPSICLRDIVASILSAIRFSVCSAASTSEEAERFHAKSRSRGAGSVIWPYLPRAGRWLLVRRASLCRRLPI